MVHVDLDAFDLDKGRVMGVATVTGFAVVMGQRDVARRGSSSGGP